VLCSDTRQQQQQHNTLHSSLAGATANTVSSTTVAAAANAAFLEVLTVLKQVRLLISIVLLDYLAELQCYYSYSDMLLSTLNSYSAAWLE
jgi:hypothetical protein